MREEVIGGLLEWKVGRPCGPHTLNVRPTDCCNLLCKSCVKGQDTTVRAIDFSGELPEERLLNLVKDAARVGVRFLNIDGGGEPLLRRDIVVRMMVEAKRHGMSGLLVTNGTLFTEEDIRTVVDICWDQILFSIDGPDAETHDFLRGVPGCFDRATGNIRRMVAYRNQKGQEKPEIVLAPVVSNANHDKIGGMVRLAHSLGLKSVYLQPLYVQTPSAQGLLLSDEQKQVFLATVPEVESIAKETGVKTNIDLLEREIIGRSEQLGGVIAQDTQRALADTGDEFLAAQCYAPWMYLGVFPDGTVVPCPSVPSHEFSVPNLKEQGLEDIWFGPFFTDFRKRMLKREFFPFCENCCGGLVLETRDYRRRLIEVTRDERDW